MLKFIIRPGFVNRIIYLVENKIKDFPKNMSVADLIQITDPFFLSLLILALGKVQGLSEGHVREVDQAGYRSIYLAEYVSKNFFFFFTFDPGPGVQDQSLRKDHVREVLYIIGSSKTQYTRNRDRKRFFKK